MNKGLIWYVFSPVTYGFGERFTDVSSTTPSTVCGSDEGPTLETSAIYQTLLANTYYIAEPLLIKAHI